ncbi:acyltransferase-domain-containing protein [Russula earlei]|uniref:Acyltransferase-domain-containing protein n=1 Tax=Russula earlei TaxID=71964 RepID=A0ACC0U3G8_9AGAM|nr:acyltransferase-domain-containing protein [Russula earlei]
MQRFLSAATVTSVGLTCKAYLNCGLCSISVRGLPHLLDALNSPERQSGQGIVTVSNHLSTLDDPLVWGALPARTYLRPHTTRWTLGASDIIFTNPVFSAFFRKGQVVETFRGAGVYQPAVDAAIEKLRSGAWLHLFAEGKVCQSHTYRADPRTGVTRLQRFKWGIGRILMETPRPPTIIPMWLTGFDDLMPEGRRSPWKYLPHPGVRLSVTFGAPIPPAAVHATLGEQEKKRVDVETRMALTDLVQRAVEDLGRKVSGDLLIGPPRE